MTQNGKKPNLILILIDDMGWRDLACYGSPFYETPNIDRLAREGMTFSDAYASCPVCSPTRASLLTGRYPATVGITNWIPGNPWGRLMGVPYFHALPREETTLAQLLRDRHYRTWHVGKWHLGGRGRWPQECGFEVNVGGCDWGYPKNGFFSPYGIPNLEDGPEGEYLTDRLTDEAIRLIRERSDRPFFLHLSHYAVHTPIQAPAGLVRKYERKAREIGLDRQQAFEEGEHFPSLHKRDQRIRRRLIQSDPVYAAMVENLDANIGRVLAALEETGQSRETLIVFTSDNGGLSTAEGSPTTNRPLCEGKGWMYDGGTRVPLIVRWPGVVEPQSRCETPTTSPDLFPTFLAAAGVELPEHLHIDGESLMPLLRGKGELNRKAIFWHYPHYSNQGDTPSCSIRAGDWKLIEFFEDGRLQLYNIREDIGEQHDLAAAQPERRQALHRQLVEWRQSVGAKIPQVNPDYQAMLRGDKPAPDGLGRIPGDDHP